jgi:hypothetical protein
MSRMRPEAGCILVSFEEAHPMDEPSEVALEDYARVLTRAQAAEAVPAAGEPGMIDGVHLCGAAQPLSPVTIADIEGFARSLLAGRAGGLGWS